MSKAARLQFVGPLLLLLVVAMAESVAYGLAENPSSALLWYWNVEVFSIFRKSRVVLANYVNQPFAQLLVISPIALLAVAGISLRANLLVAISSNLSFVFAGFLLLSWLRWNGSGQVHAASLASIQMPTGSDLWLFLVLLLTSFASFAISHFRYVRMIRSGLHERHQSRRLAHCSGDHCGTAALRRRDGSA